MIVVEIRKLFYPFQWTTIHEKFLFEDNSDNAIFIRNKYYPLNRKIIYITKNKRQKTKIIFPPMQRGR